VLVEDATQRAHSGRAGVIVERLAQSVGVDHVPLVGLVDRPLEVPRSHHRDEIEESLNWLGEGDVPAAGDRTGRQGVASVPAHATEAYFGGAPEADVDVVGVLLPETPERRCTAMAQRRTRAAGEHGCHPPSLAVELPAPHRVDASKYRV
jgi:hypothetical protein